METIAFVSEFFDSIHKEFDFLSKQHGFQSVYGFASHHVGRVVITPPPADLSAVERPFEATYRFETDRRDVKFTLDSETRLLNCFINYDKTYRLTLCDLHHLLAPSRNTDAQEGTLQIPVETPDQLRKGIQALRAILEPDLDIYLNPPDDFIALATASSETIIDHLKEDPIEALLNKDLDEARREACLAFEAGDYKRTIMLYRPHKEHLSEDDLEIFTLAFQRLQE